MRKQLAVAENLNFARAAEVLKITTSAVSRQIRALEDKSVGDSKALVPVLTDFFTLHPDFHPDTFLGDSAFDSAELYGFLINDFHFSKALIPYNPRNESSLKKIGYNEYGFFIF